MIELRFHRDVYAGTSVDEAVKTFAAYATLDLMEDAEHWVVRVSSESPVRERRVAGELGNYALGLTVKVGGPDLTRAVAS